jgi:hypothetical protein
MAGDTILKRTAAAFTAVFLAASIFTGCGDKSDTSEDNTSAENNTSSSDEVSSADLGYVNADWSYGQVEIGGGGFVTGVFSTCEEGVYYARTDVGGAYRWDESEQRWKSLSYWVSESDVGLLGIDGLAVDPNDASKVYLIAGTEYFSGGETAVLCSSDYGETFEVVDVSDLIRVHGNGMGRGNGERIAVDPNNSDVIFIGGRTGGMIKSTDGGKTWESVSSFPVTSTSNGNGINSIAFDSTSSVSDGVTQRIYASVSQKNTDDGNFFVSEDGGNTWSLVENAVNEYMPERIKLDSEGNVYVVYANNEGPWNCALGGVYRYNASDKSCESIAPELQSYGDIVIDPNDNNRLILVSTGIWKEQPNGSFGDVFYTSTDGGKTWTNIMDKITMSTNGMSWIENCAIHWCCSLAINPFNADEILVTSGNGIFACDNIWSDSPEFYFDARGIEETVPMDIISMDDYPLVSAVGDYDGFVHDDIYTPASRHSTTVTIGSTTSITIAYQNRDLWAKVGGSSSEQLLVYSTDGGTNWNYIENSPEEGKIFYNGSVALTADGSRLIWSSENGLTAYYTEDWGETWNAVSGIVGSGVYLIGDPENSDYVYGCGNGNVYISSDGGKSFSKMSLVNPSYNRLCVIPGEEGSFYIAGGAGLYKATDHGENVELVQNAVRCEAVSIGKAKNDGDPYVIYIYGTTVGNDTTGIYMSEDNGATWSRVNDDSHQFGGTGNGTFISGDMNVYGRCYMSTVGLGIIYCDKNEK